MFASQTPWVKIKGASLQLRGQEEDPELSKEDIRVFGHREETCLVNTLGDPRGPWGNDLSGPACFPEEFCLIEQVTGGELNGEGDVLTLVTLYQVLRAKVFLALNNADKGVG